MAELSEYIKKADWKTEKHVPAIECPDAVKAGTLSEVTVTLGKTAHPNTTDFKGEVKR
jgi:superoxide reductase